MINQNYFLLNVLLLTLGTVTIRGLFIALSGKLKISDRIRELFSFIPAAILPAFIVPATFFHQGMSEALAGKERFLVLIASGLVFYFVRSTFLTIVTGLSLLYAITYLS